MEKKEIKIMNLKPKVVEMEGARGATGISTTAALRESGVKGKVPKPMAPPEAAWINKPVPENSDPLRH